MARYTGPRARLCRRLEFPVFESPKFGNIRKNYAPGQHGQGKRGKLSNYGRSGGVFMVIPDTCARPVIPGLTLNTPLFLRSLINFF